jgi:hypothetical protein
VNFRSLACITTFALTLGACTDGEETDVADETGETGDGDGDNEQTGPCGELTETALDDLFVTPPGFATALNELLAMSEGNFEGTFSWYAAEGPWTTTYAGTESPMTAAMAYSGGAVRLVEVEKLGEIPDGEGGGWLCSNYVVVDVILEFATMDGAFAESWVVPLTIQGTEGEFAPSINHSLDLDALMGNLDLGDFMIESGTLTDAVLSGYVSSSGFVGELGIEVLTGEGPDAAVGFGGVAEFNAARL